MGTIDDLADDLAELAELLDAMEYVPIDMDELDAMEDVPIDLDELAAMFDAMELPPIDLDELAAMPNGDDGP